METMSRRCEAADPPAIRVRCAECGEEFSSTHEMVEIEEDVWVHEGACPRWSPGVAALALFGAVLGFLSGLWIFAQLGPWWPVGIVLAAVFAVLAVLVIERA